MDSSKRFLETLMIVVVCLLVGILPCVSGWSEDTFNNSLTSENLTFTENENITRWLSVPENAVVTNGYLNLSGWKASYFLNEDPPGSTRTKIQDWGIYYTLGKGQNITVKNKEIDKIAFKWKCYSASCNGNVYYKVRYKNNDSILAECDVGSADVGDIGTWRECDFTNFITGEQELIFSIERDTVPMVGEIKVFVETDLTINHDIYNNFWGKSWEYSNNSGTLEWSVTPPIGRYLVMNITLTNGDNFVYPENITLLINNTSIWDQTGIFNSTNSPQTTSSLATTINNYISTATAVAGYYIIPFIFHSDTAGILEYLGLVFNNNGFIENSITYNSNSYETATETLSLNITYDNIKYRTIETSLWYDGTEYISTEVGSGSTLLFNNEISIPLTDTITNHSFYWTLKLTDNTGTVSYNTTSNNQTVTPIFFGLCNVTYTTHALDIDIKEEGTFDDLNGTLEFSADYCLGDGTIKKPFTFSYLENDTNSYDFCISPTDKTFYIDDIISYTAEDYERRDYFLTNAEISNATMNLSLYLAATTTTDIFTITVQDENNNPVEGAFVNVERWDIGTNNFYTIGIVKTTSDGSGIINMRLNDAWYIFQVSYNDKLYLTTEPRKESGTSRVLNINLAASNPYSEFGNIDYSLTYNEDTNVSVFTYSDITGAVATGCLKVLKVEGNGTTEVYYSCVQSSSGKLSYEIEDDGTYIIRAIFRLTSDYDNVEQVVDEIIRQGTSVRFAIIGKFGQVISLMLIGTAAILGVAIGSIPLGLGLIGTSLVLVNLLGWLNITGLVLYGLISIIILIAINLRRVK